MRRAFILLLLAVVIPACGSSAYNGFDLSDASLPLDEIHQGGPPRDGIPAIDRPRFISPDEAAWLKPDDPVLGLALDGAARAYPVRILDYHEIVNDRIDGASIVVSYCPLCGAGMVFRLPPDRDSAGFGVSGLLYNSDMLLYDRASESLWSQILARAISGPRKGERLESVPLEHTTWEDWRKRHPDTRVLSRDTGYQRDYARSPYPGYASDKGLYFPVSRLDRRYHPKARVLGLVVGDDARVYPFDELSQVATPFDDRVGGQVVKVFFDAKHGNARVLDAAGRPMAAVTGYWFAWMAFHPDSRVFRAKEAFASVAK